MATHGEDSLNEHSEEENLEVDSAPESALDALRMKLGKSTRNSEPTREQLIATGELEPDEPEEGIGEEPGEVVEPDKGSEAPGSAEQAEKPTTDLTIASKELGIRKQIEQRAAAGATQDELIAEGFNKRSVQTIFSELKGKGKLPARARSGRTPGAAAEGLQVFAKGSPPEAIISALQVPDVADGQGFSFEQGMKFGLSVAVLGIRMAQELSGIGVMQAKPLLDMAKSMREGEAVAAKNAAGEAAMDAAGMVRDSMMPLLMNIQRSGGGEGTDPVRSMMVRTMEPLMRRLMGSVVGRLIPGTQPLQITEGQGKVDGWSRRSE